MAGKKSSAKPGGQAQFEPTVDRFLVALQKTLSRVSRDSASVPAGQARSLIVGNVDFSVELQCELEEGEQLRMDPEGSVHLALSGRLATDLGVESTGEGNDGSQERTTQGGKESRKTKAGSKAGTRRRS